MRMQHMKEFDSYWTVIEFKTEHEMNWDKCLAYSNYICDCMDNPDCTIAREYCYKTYNFRIMSDDNLDFMSVVKKMNVIGEWDVINLHGSSSIFNNQSISFILSNKSDIIKIMIPTKSLKSFKKDETEDLIKEEVSHIFDKFMNEVEIKGEELFAKRADAKDSIEIYDLMDRIFKNLYNVKEEAYEQEFWILYSLLWEFDIISNKLINEIIYIEEKRNSEKYFPNFVEELTPVDVVKKYSDIAFWLAQERFLTNKTFEIASQMNEILKEAIQEDFLTNEEKQCLEKEISETQLDFQYASGSNKFTSARIAPYIKSKAIWLENYERKQIKDYSLINQILEKFPNVQRQVYEQEFQLFYRTLWELDVIPDNIKEEIVYIEEKRLSKGYYHRSEEDITPAVFVRWYSALSFWLAQEHCLNNKTFEVAALINEVFLEALDYLTPNERKQLRTEISETQLDFLYASGSDRIASIRMAPYIRAQAIWVKKGLA